jgi:hypothetical protein
MNFEFSEFLHCSVITVSKFFSALKTFAGEHHSLCFHALLTFCGVHVLCVICVAGMDVGMVLFCSYVLH